MLSLITDVLLKPYFDEKLRAFKYEQYFGYASGLLQKEDLPKARKGLAVLAELARNYPYRTQEIIDAICSFVRKGWKKDLPYAKEWNEVLSAAFRILASCPKKDSNEHPYYVEVSGIRVQNLELKGINLEYFVLWETEFLGVNMTRSSFRNTDLGGCQFALGTSVEWSDFSGALMNVGILNQMCTTFDRVRLWGSNFNDARIDRCQMIINDGFDVTELKAKLGGRLLVQQVSG